ncbi:hypothetical protein AADZ90_004510 [Aestuariibius sp. 2305UL40-4]|uniref:hypothetical protein n=1 Tax=Aestuariibius violaceus TaxID=3234132 RepID=UPI00345E2E38
MSDVGVKAMSTYLSREVREGLEAARAAAARRKSRLRLTAGGKTYPVLRIWETGFALDADDAPILRGFVDLFDGSRHIAQCLIVASQDEAGERQFEFKLHVRADATAPRDFEMPDHAPVALLT